MKTPLRRRRLFLRRHRRRRLLPLRRRLHPRLLPRVADAKPLRPELSPSFRSQEKSHRGVRYRPPSTPRPEPTPAPAHCFLLPLPSPLLALELLSDGLPESSVRPAPRGRHLSSRRRRRRRRRPRHRSLPGPLSPSPPPPVFVCGQRSPPKKAEESAPRGLSPRPAGAAGELETRRGLREDTTLI